MAAYRRQDDLVNSASVGTNLLSPEAVAVGSGGMVYIANNRVIKMTQSVRNHAAGNNGGLHMRR
jgi:hypothetical protein